MSQILNKLFQRLLPLGLILAVSACTTSGGSGSKAGQPLSIEQYYAQDRDQVDPETEAALTELIPEEKIARPWQLHKDTVISIAYPRPDWDKGGDPDLPYRVVVSLVNRIDFRSIFVDGSGDREVELVYVPDFNRYRVVGPLNAVKDKRPSVDLLIPVPRDVPLRVRRF